MLSVNFCVEPASYQSDIAIGINDNQLHINAMRCLMQLVVLCFIFIAVLWPSIGYYSVINVFSMAATSSWSCFSKGRRCSMFLQA